MKFIGQYIQSFIARFRSDVYLEDISTGTIASGGNLGLDSNNKIVKAAGATGDLTSIIAGTGLSGTDLTGPIPTLNLSLTDLSTATPTSGDYLATLDGNTPTHQITTTDSLATLFAGTGLTASNAVIGVDASQTQITRVGTIATGVWQGTAIATDQQKHLATFDIRGYSTADGTNYEIPVFVTDNNAPFEHNTSAGPDGLTALAVTSLIRATGVVMPYAGTLKKWKGWATHSTTSGTCNIALFRYRPVAGNSSDVSLVLLDAVSHTPAANNTVIAIDETAFTDADIAAGDVIISGIKGDGAQVTYFVSTLEIEWD